MSPLSLLFSSDEETSRRISQALKELELEVEPCPEIFAAVEKLTSRSFDVIVADMDEGLEASFLLKTSRELKSNRDAFEIAIASADASAAARQAGADLVLSKPVLPEKVKYALLTCDEFLSRMQTWLPKLSPPVADEAAAPIVASEPLPPPPQGRHAVEPWPIRPAEPSPASHSAVVASSMPVTPPLAISDGGFFHRSGIQSLLQSEPARSVPPQAKGQHRYRSVLWVAAFGTALLSAGYVFSEPARSQAVAGSVTKIYDRAVAKTHDWLRTTGNDDDDETWVASELAQNSKPRSAQSRMGASTRIRVTEVRDPLAPNAAMPATGQPEPLPTEAPVQSASAAPGLLIPESLRFPLGGATVRTVAAKLSPSLLSMLEPVNLPEELAQKLLLQKVQPSYPEQALQAGLQGPVVLQAWIGRDGAIRDLKLIRGPLLLGQAAYQAVKQWRYKPYVLNGQAVETQTYVTVDFKQP